MPIFRRCLALLAVVTVSGHASAAGPEPYNTEQSTLPFTSPADAVAGMTLPEGFKVNVFAAEPDVQQPIGIALDSRNRIWIAENYTYAEQGKGFDRDLRDRIVMLEDSDGDGACDKRKVFWDQGTCITSVETDTDGIWVLDLPNLLFIPDRDHDDVPDSEPIVMVDGFDRDSIRHNFANGLRWGPDGWLYGRHGILATSWLGPPGTAREQRVPINCGIWRYHPERKVVEAVAHGTTNPWGMDWDENGQLFFINTVIGHMWHVIPGAHYERMFGEHLRSNLYEFIPQTADHFHWDTREVWSDIRKLGVTPTTDEAGGGHAHSGMLIYQGTQWPKEYRGSVFTVNLHGHRLNRDTLQREGATYVAKHAPDFMKVADPWFRGIDLITGLDGSVFVADWTDVGECHENDGVHRTSGRIYRISYPGGRTDSDSQIDGDPLLADLFSTNEVRSRFALRALRNPADPHSQQSAINVLTKQLESSDSERVRLRSLWGLNMLHAAPNELLLRTLKHDKSEHVRAWVLQLLSDGRPLTGVDPFDLVTMAEAEKSGLVLTFYASTLPSLPPREQVSLAMAIQQHSEFANDHVLPLMVWYGLEPIVTTHAEGVFITVTKGEFPTVRRLVTRRMCSSPATRPQTLERLALVLPTVSDEIRIDLLNGMAEGLKGIRRVEAAPRWKDAAAVLAKSESADVRQRTQELSVIFGDGRAIEEIKAIAADGGADSALRRQALQTLVEAGEPSVVPLLQGLLNHRDLSIDAVRGLAAVHGDQTAALLVENFNKLQPNARYEAVTTLASRPEFAAALLGAVADGKIGKDQVSPFLLRQIQTFGNAELTAKVDGLWPELKQLSADKQQKIADWKTRLSSDVLEQSNASRGRALFEQSCAKCHRLFGSPMGVGPDLTGSQRSNLHYLLENILDPSAQVAENYRLAIVLLDDGRVINGIPGAKTETTTTFNTPTGPIIVDNSQIEDQRFSPLSFMPDGQLDLLTPAQAADLIKYLMQPEQVPLP